jgi:hypothetical protein
MQASWQQSTVISMPRNPVLMVQRGWIESRKVSNSTQSAQAIRLLKFCGVIGKCTVNPSLTAQFAAFYTDSGETQHGDAKQQATG